MSFQERAKLGLESLSKQLPVTLKQAKDQVKKLKTQSRSNQKKSQN
jgi:hypothetical protein